MTEALFGFIGVVIGSFIPWIQTSWTNKQATKRNARYLAIRVVCILDKYLEDCADVVRDNGLSFGERTIEGYLSPQVKAPGPPVFPDDVDWKSIDHKLMYSILSFPSDVEAAESIIRATENIASPPDFEEWFDERAFRYGKIGLIASKLSEQLSETYHIQKKIYDEWDPITELKEKLSTIENRRAKRIQQQKEFVQKVLSKKKTTDAIPRQ